MGPEFVMSGAAGSLEVAASPPNYEFAPVDNDASEQGLNFYQSFAVENLSPNSMGYSGLSARDNIRTNPDRAWRALSLRNIGGSIALMDFFVIVVAIGVTCAAYENFADSAPGMRLFVLDGLQSGLLFVILTAAQGLYQTPVLLSRAAQLKAIGWGWLLVCLWRAVLVLLQVPHPFSLGSMSAYIAVVPALLLASRIFLVGKLRRSIFRGTLQGRRAIVVGDAEELASVTALDLRQLYAIELVAKCTLRSPNLETRVINDLIHACRARGAEKVVLALPWNDTRRIERVLEQLRVLPLAVVLMPDRSARTLAQKASQWNSTAIAMELQRAPLTYTDAMIKRTFDLVLGGALLCSLLPVLILAGIAVIVDSPGPVIFRQRRRGFNGAEFKINKFRTMTVLEDGPIIIQSRPNDARVTRVGQMLRRTSIDELPQLLNVLSGEMSLIGPRPHAIAHDVHYGGLVSNYAARHRIKPGITGWAQINGLRGQTSHIGSMERRIDLDLWYINHWTVWLDLKILLLTLVEVVRARRAF